MKKLITAITIIFLAGCATQLPPSRPHVGGTANPGDRLDGYGFSIAAPASGNWLIAELQPDAIAIASQGASADATFAVQANTIKLPEFKSEEDARKFVAVFAEEYKNSVSERFKTIDTEYRFYTNEADKVYCVDYTITMEDKKAVKRTENTDPMIMKVIGTACQHPELKTMGVVFGFSQRFYPRHEDPMLAEKAKMTKAQFRFEPIPVDAGS